MTYTVRCGRLEGIGDVCMDIGLLVGYIASGFCFILTVVVQCRQSTFALQEAWSGDYVAGGCVLVWNVRISYCLEGEGVSNGQTKGFRNTTSILSRWVLLS